MTNDTALLPEGPVSRAALEAWLDGRLTEEQADDLRSWVRRPTPWREAYSAFLRELATESVIPRFDAARTISVAADDRELDHARLIDRLPLPHLGPNAIREGRLTKLGTTWRVVGSERDVAALHRPYGETRIAWEDSDLGVIETNLREVPMTPLQCSQDALSSLVRLAAGLEHPRAGSIALEAARELVTGSLHDGLAMAREAFVEAKLDDAEEVAWAVCALETQLALDRLAHRLCDPELDSLILDADRALAPLGEALMLLEDHHYAELVEEPGVDETAWWGFRARLDTRVPESRLEAGLDDLTAERDPTYTDVVRLSDHRTTAKESPAQPPRLRAVAAANEPGAVSILVALDAPGRPEHGRGHVLRATIKRGGSGTPFERCEWFGVLAKDAIRDAYQAVATLCRDGVAPYPLEEHTVLLDDAGILDSVDGSSLGLSFALAFASLWTDEPVAETLCATGRLHSTGGPWTIKPVDLVPAKVAAARDALGTDAAVLVAPEQEDEVARGGLSPRRVDSVSDALADAGLDVSGVAGAWPDNASRAGALEALIAATQSQDVARYGAFGNPWVVVARRMQALCAALDGTKYKALVARSRPLIGLAYVHAGELRAAKADLENIDLDAQPTTIRLAARIARLNAAIDAEDKDLCVCEARAIDALLTEISHGEHADLVGQALGTKGRAHLHAREFQTAEHLLRCAAEHHDRYCPEESGRSRVYLAQAQRNLGRTGDALATLDQAQRDLDAYTRPDSAAYFQSCWMYLQHERARVLVAQGDGDVALPCVREALVLSRHLDFWPKLGVLRTTAWVYRLLGEHDRADECVEEMKALEVPESHADLRDRLVDEAEGFPQPGGEVY